jgi:hypothetical protein
MESLSAKCLCNEDNFFKLADYWEEQDKRQSKIQEFLKWVENTPEFQDETVGDTPEVQELTEDEVIQDDVLFTINKIKTRLAAQFESE